MKINQQELEAAIENISEGGTALGVSCDDVYDDLLEDRALGLRLFLMLHEACEPTDLEKAKTEFLSAFKKQVESQLMSSLRAKMENDNGLD
jgi:hypothetical protein